MQNQNLGERNLFFTINLLFSFTLRVSGIAKCLEKRVLTKSTNNDVFNSILQEFRKGLSEDIFIKTNKIKKVIFLLWTLNNYS